MLTYQPGCWMFEHGQCESSLWHFSAIQSDSSVWFLCDTTPEAYLEANLCANLILQNISSVQK